MGAYLRAVGRAVVDQRRRRRVEVARVEGDGVEGGGGARSQSWKETAAHGRRRTTATAAEDGEARGGGKIGQAGGVTLESPLLVCTCAEKRVVIWGRRSRGNLRQGPFVPGRGIAWDKRVFCPGSWPDPGQKPHPLVPGRGMARDKRVFFAWHQVGAPK